MERKTYGSIVEKYGNKEGEVNISFGLRPSGTIHLGNMMTMALAAGLARDIGPHRTNLNVTICDLDLPDGCDWDTRKYGFVKHYRNIPGSEDGEYSMAEHATNDIKGFLGSLEKVVHARYEFRTLTDIQRDERFREGVKRILDNPDAMKFILPKLPKNSVLVYPLCERCDTSYSGNRKGKKITYENGVIHSFCTNPDCSVDEYDMDVTDTSQDLAVHLFIDPLRDAVMEPFADVHVFGGDYAVEHGANKVPKFEKIARLIDMAASGAKVPDLFIGPTIYAKDGNKMSKSLVNGLDFTHLRNFLGEEEYPARILDFTMSLVKEGYNHVDYATVSERLLS